MGTPGLPIIAPPFKIKILVDASAASETSVRGVVFTFPAGSDIVGTKIGEFSGKTFDAALFEGEAQLLVHCVDFGGGSLGYGDDPVVLVRNSTYTSGIIPATLTEE